MSGVEIKYSEKVDKEMGKEICYKVSDQGIRWGNSLVTYKYLSFILV